MNGQSLPDRIRTAFRDEGLAALNKKRAFAYLRWLRPSYATYYMYENNLDGPDLAASTEGIELMVVSEPQDFDRLAAEGRGFGYWNMQEFKDKARVGAVALCVFVQNQLAHITWIAFDQTAHEVVDPFPLKVDWDTEAWIGSCHTAVQYRGMGLYPYALSQMSRLLKQKGLVRGRCTVLKSNNSSRKAWAKVGSRVVGEGSCLRVGWWRHYWARGFVRRSR